MPCGELKVFNEDSQTELYISFPVRNISFLKSKSVIFLLCIFVLFNLYCAFIGIFGPHTVPEFSVSIILVDINLFT